MWILWQTFISWTARRAHWVDGTNNNSRNPNLHSGWWGRLWLWLRLRLRPCVCRCYNPGRGVREPFVLTEQCPNTRTDNETVFIKTIYVIIVGYERKTIFTFNFFNADDKSN